MAGEIEPPAGMREFLVKRATQITNEVNAELTANNGDLDPQQLKAVSKKLKEARRAIKVARDISVVNPTDLTAGVEIQLPAPDIDETDSIPNHESQRPKWQSVGSIQRTLVDAALRVNETTDGFLFDNVLKDTATEKIFPEKVSEFDDLPPNKRKRKIHSLTGASYRSFRAIAGRLRALDDPDSVDRDGKMYLDEIRASNPRFADLSAGEIADLLERKIPFPGSTQTETPIEEQTADQDNDQAQIPINPPQIEITKENSRRTIFRTGPTQRRAILLGLELNEDGSGFKYTKPWSKSLVAIIFADKLTGLNKKDAYRKIQSYSGNVYQSVRTAAQSLTSLEENQLLSDAQNLINEIRAIDPRFRNLTLKQISDLLMRKITIDSLDSADITPTVDKQPMSRQPIPVAVPDPEIVWKSVRRLPPAVPRPLLEKPRIHTNDRRHLPPPNHLNGKSHGISVEQDLDLGNIPNPNLPRAFQNMSKGELAAYLLLQLNQTRTSFRYQTAEEAIYKFPMDFQQALDALTPEKRKAFQKNYSEFDVVTISAASFAEQLRKYNIDDVTKREPTDAISRFLNWANSNRALETFTPSELADLIQRKTPFKIISEAYFENPKYGSFQADKDTVIKRRIPDFDLIRLKKIVATLPPEILRRGEIQIPEEFKALGEEIASREQSDDDLRNGIKLSTGTLIRRLRAFFADPANYCAQISDPTEILILNCLESLAKKPVTREMFLKYASC